MNAPANPVADNLKTVRNAIAQSEHEAQRTAGSVQLVAVSKTFDAAEITPVLEAGQRIFGENRVQEAQGKWPELRERFSDIELHLIGPLQSNKSAEAVALFDVIQTVDREKIAASLAVEIKKQNRAVKLFVQVNTGSEEQKAGIDPREAVGFVARCRDVHGLEIAGLMCIPPVDENPGPHFALLRKLATEAGVSELSMGMSGDFETAIAFGATYVRVGSAIFGSRPPLTQA
ncbi:YggS family pyridoxal phosphate-dependent enzyme [Pseudochrobactrum sp. sp1633]|uniref:YggS family pyridoxal phosphate-dependent enzyme n=1 Tax=Pseudochrobactrum sp. sp1633 TaxID=3036706 RepID=UPI0025A64021|nr:YggS family pyridoxal phosphate-dependent enzyme [Pseudochrobactrum sp. sp1633]MDM8345784.1 YggS family pyridoxal phosphate-dependent enzyme [Pseudochrobactrum sp. sp1633]HWD12488.1 YggS family pyridoxal phosphate-dependent enzyme [Pseudochrobactrum sp.]